MNSSYQANSTTGGFGTGLAPSSHHVGNFEFDSSTLLKDLHWAFLKVQLMVTPANVSAEPNNGTAEAVVFEATLAPRHLRELRLTDLSIRLGNNSDNLFVVRFSDSASLSEFQKANPLVQTLVTSTSAGPVIWLRSTDYLPPNQAFAGLEVLSEGDVPIYYVDPMRTAPAVLHAQPVSKIGFWDIVWPAKVALQYRLEKLITEHGDPVIKDPDTGRRKLNRILWSHMLVQEFRVAFNPDARRFLQKDRASEAWRDIPHDKILLLLFNLLQAIASRPGCEGLRLLCNQREGRDVLSTLRVLAIRSFPNGDEALHSFLTQRVHRAAGRNVTVLELYTGFLEFCRSIGSPPLSLNVFRDKIGPLITDIFLIPKSKSVERNGKSQNGFRGLAIKGAEVGPEVGVVGTRFPAAAMASGPAL